jgi:hypothetical protein
MHAVVVTVSIASGQIAGARAALRDQVIPRVSKAPGFVKGYWTASSDQHRGLSFVIFSTRQEADQAASTVRSMPTPPGVTLNDVEVREIVGEA